MRLRLTIQKDKGLQLDIKVSEFWLYVFGLYDYIFKLMEWLKHRKDDPKTEEMEPKK